MSSLVHSVCFIIKLLYFLFKRNPIENWRKLTIQLLPSKRKTEEQHTTLERDVWKAVWAALRQQASLCTQHSHEKVVK